MTKIIRISQDVYEAMRNLAVPFTDTPDSVLRRQFGLKPKKMDPRARPLKEERENETD